MLSKLSSEKLEVLSKLLLYGLDLSCNLGTDLVLALSETWVGRGFNCLFYHSFLILRFDSLSKEHS